MFIANLHFSEDVSTSQSLIKILSHGGKKKKKVFMLVLHSQQLMKSRYSEELVGNSRCSSWKNLLKYSIVFSKYKYFIVLETFFSEKENSCRKLGSFLKYSQNLLLEHLQELLKIRRKEELKLEANYSKVISYSLVNKYFIYDKL